MYTEERVAELFPGIWDEQRVFNQVDEQAPDPEMPRAKYRDPRRSTDAVTEMADVQRAWALADLSLQERQSLLLRLGLHLTFEQAAHFMPVSDSAVARSVKSGMAEILAFLNEGWGYYERPA